MMFENDFKLLMLITELCYTPGSKNGAGPKMQSLPVAAGTAKPRTQKKK